MIHRYALIVGLTWGLAGATRAAEPPVSLSFSRDIKPPALQQEELIAVPLEGEIFAETRDDFPDLRVLEGDGSLVPFLIRRVKLSGLQAATHTWRANRVSIKPREASLELTVQLENGDPPPRGLTIVTPLRNFEQRIRLQSSVDGKVWEPLGEESLIFDYSQYMNLRQESLSFPETDRKFIWISIDKPTVAQESELLELTRRLQGKSESERTEKTTIDRQPFRIDRIDFHGETRQSKVTGDKKARYALDHLTLEPDPKLRRTVVSFTSHREPLTSLSVETPDRNFSRHAVLFVEEKHGTQTVWTQLGAGILSHIDFKTLHQQELTLRFPERRATRYRLDVDNYDGPPLHISQVAAEGNCYELLLLASPNRTYRLAYGSPQAPPPHHDTAAIHELLRTGFQPVPAQLGPPALHPVPLGPPQPEPKFEWSNLFNNTPLLLSVIAILASAMGFGLYRAMQRVEKIPGD